MAEGAGRLAGKIAVALAGWSAFIDLYAPQPLLTNLASDFGVTATRASLSMTVATLAVAMVAPFSGMAADLLGRKRVIASAVLILTLPTLGAALSASFEQFLLWRFLQGLMLPAIFGVTLAYIGEEWDPRDVPAVTSIYISGSVLGGFTGRLLPGLIAEVADWRAGFLTLGVLNGLSAIAIVILMPRERRFVATSSIAATLSNMRRHLGNAQLLATCACGFGVLFTQVAVFTFINLYLAAPPFGLSSGALGAIFSIFLVGVVVTPLAGRSINRVGHRGALALSTTVMLAGLALSLASTLPVILVGLTLVSSGVFISHSIASSYIPRAATGGRSSAVGLYVACYYVGGSFGAAGPALVWSSGGWPACVALTVAVQAVTVTTALLAWRRRTDSAPIGL